MSKHTPGPWKVDTRVTVKYITNAVGQEIVRFTTGPFFLEETDEANARLIAASPELFKIVEMCLSHFRGHDSVSGSALIDDDTTLAMACEKVIAKAEGRNHE